MLSLKSSKTAILFMNSCERNYLFTELHMRNTNKREVAWAGDCLGLEWHFNHTKKCRTRRADTGRNRQTRADTDRSWQTEDKYKQANTSTNRSIQVKQIQGNRQTGTSQSMNIYNKKGIGKVFEKYMHTQANL